MNVIFACGKCQAPLHGPEKPEPDSMLICPTCGESDTFENVKGIVGQFVQEQAADALGDMLRNVRRNSESLTFRETQRPKTTYRFVAIERG